MWACRMWLCMKCMPVEKMGGTRTSSHRKWRLLQDCNMQITLIDERMKEIVQPSLIDSDDDETLPDGPMLCTGNIIGTTVHTICWSNNRMAFCVMPIITHDENIIEIIRGLENMPLWGIKTMGDAT